MKKTSRAKKIALQQAVFVIYGSLKEATQGFFYVAVPGEKIEAVMHAIKGGFFAPGAFGTVILRQGQGVPPDAVKQEMRDRYGCRHDLAVTLPGGGK